MSNYMFEAAPRVLPKGNIHFDKRVVRGNTYAAQLPDSTLQLVPPPAPVRRHPLGATRQSNSAARRRLLGQADPTPVAGRSHMLVQTDDFLEELVDQIFEQDSFTQTEGDGGAEEAWTAPVFVPKPMGEDAATHIEEGDLFDFELACEPLLEVLVGKALEQSLGEVLEEEELRRLKERREQFHQQRNQIVTETQRLEAQALVRQNITAGKCREAERHAREKERRMAQEAARVKAEREVARKAAARTAAKNLLSGLQAQVVSQLQAAGHLYDPVVQQVENVFLPWLMQATAGKLNLVKAAREEVDALIGSAVQHMKAAVEEQKRVEEEARQAEIRRKQEEEEARRKAEEEEKRRKEEEEAKRLEEERLAAEEEERQRRAEEEGEEGEDGEEEQEDEEEEADE